MFALLPPGKPGSFNTEFIKYAVLILGTPYWWPFVKALWQELNDSLRDEGGLLGRTPHAEELAKQNRELGAFESPLVSELRPGPGGARRTTNTSPRASSDGGPLRTPRGSAAKGFRSASERAEQRRGFR